MDLGIEGRVALVTAATRGIGLGIAQALAAEGARVAVAARTEADVQNVAKMLNGLGVAADLLTEEGCRHAVNSTVDNLGPIDILVNNLGTRYGTSWAAVGSAVGSAVVVISSVYGRESGGAPAYNAAKAAEISVVTSLAREVASPGVTVNGVAPGSVLWDGGGWDRRQKQDPEGIAEFIWRDLPMKRFGSVPEVANVVAFLCSEQASLVNGACVAVDGGQSRSNI